MDYTYKNVRQEGDLFWGCATLAGAYVEIPFNHSPSEQEVRQKVIYELSEIQVPVYEIGVDSVYCDGVLVRKDVFYKKEPVISVSEAYRPPYYGGLKSKYTWETPSTELLNSWNVTDYTNLAYWYGIKEIDGVDKFLKVVRYEMDWPNTPKTPGQVWVYASLYDANGIESDERDIFFRCYPECMKLWCEDNGLTYPIPESETKTPWCFGVIWEASTGNILKVKGYVRHDESGEFEI